MLSAANGEQTDSKLEETLAKQKPPIDSSDDGKKIPSEGEDSVAGEDSIADSMEGDDSIAQVDVVDGADRDSDGCDGAILVEEDVDDEDDEDASLDTTFYATADDHKTTDNKGINLTNERVIFNEFCVKKVLWALIQARSRTFSIASSRIWS